MSDFNTQDSHVPTPEFRAGLEREIVTAFRREARFDPPMRPGLRATMWPRMAAAIVFGLVAGISAAATSTRVAEARQRQEIASTTGAKRELAAVQRDLTRVNYEQLRRAFDRGEIAQSALLAAEAELQASNARVERLEVDLAESALSAAPPRDELWAPLVGRRDFVAERLAIDERVARQKLASVQATVDDANRAYRANLLTQSAVADAQSHVLQAKRDVAALAQKLALRKRFLEQHLAPEDVARRLQRFELETDVARAEQLLRLAQERLAIARERSGLVAPAQAKVKQAAVAALEGSLELEQLRLTNARTVLTFVEPAAPPQQGVPTIDLPAASAKTTDALRNVFGVREVVGGKLLVNDAGHRQIRLFDSTLATFTVVFDSTTGAANSYGPQRVPLIGYRGDSSIVPSVESRTLRVLDGRGQLARTIALPDGRFVLGAPGYTDDRGRVLFGSLHDFTNASDSAPILRVDLDSRRVDTAARIETWRKRDSTRRGFPPVNWSKLDKSQFALVTTREPFVDEWAVLSDGSIVVVRSGDYSQYYHVDWIRPDGAIGSSPPFPKPANDFTLNAGKDSTAAVRWFARDSLSMMRLRLSYLRVVDRFTGALTPLGNMPAIPDLDGNLWILPNGMAPSTVKSLVYDVVNGKGQLLQRVRVPAGRSVVGFGKGGVVYLTFGDRRSGFSIERTQLAPRR